MAKTIRYFAAYVPSINQTVFRSSPTMAYVGVVMKDGRFYGFTTRYSAANVFTVEITKAGYAKILAAKTARVAAIIADLTANGGWTGDRFFGSGPSASFVIGDMMPELEVVA